MRGVIFAYNKRFRARKRFFTFEHVIAACLGGITIPARLIISLLLVYVLWGSTYLAIASAIKTIPAFFMAGSRFLIAGSILYLYMRYVKGERVPKGTWPSAWIMSTLLLLGGNGGVVFAEQYVPSGVTALLIGSGPFWFALLGWLWLKGPRPRVSAICGLVIGFVGLVVLIGPGRISGAASHAPLLPSLLVIGSALSWSVGSIYSKTLKTQASPMMMSALQMLAGFFLLTGSGLLHGEYQGFSLRNVTTESWVAYIYLIVFGSLVGFSAYIYVLRHATPAVTSTYAYVNPVIAVFLGWAVADEPVTWRTICAAALIVGAVILISWPKRRPPQLARDPAGAEHG